MTTVPTNFSNATHKGCSVPILETQKSHIRPTVRRIKPFVTCPSCHGGGSETTVECNETYEGFKCKVCDGFGIVSKAVAVNFILQISLGA